MAGLKLRAGDAEDLAVISAILQDSLVSVSEMAYLPEESRFVLVANRFRWEPELGERRKNFERVLSGLCFDEVKRVQRRGFNPNDANRILSLLAIRREQGHEAGEGEAALILDFAGGGSVRVEVGRITCRLDDLGEPWPTRWRPKHAVVERE
jgi:Protein of unknown function (DUF2948)